MLGLICIFVFITISLFAYALLKGRLGAQKAIFRLNNFVETEELREAKKKDAVRGYKSGIKIITNGLKNVHILEGYNKSIQQKLTRAHVLLKPEEFIMICGVAFLVTGLLFFAITGKVVTGLITGVGGWFLPSIFLKSGIKKRLKRLNEQLGDCLVLLSNSLKAGYSFFQAVDIVAKEMNGPVSEEFGILQKEMTLGLATEKALESLVKRVGSDDLEIAVTAVQIQRQVGGNLSEVLDNISNTIRERVKIKGDIRTITATGRISALIISLLPPTLGLLIYLINPTHMAPLFKTPIGLAIILGSVFMELLGIYFISKIVKVEV
ncbi:MAG: type II secretion system F family protein [Clostridiales bacterium]|nr:type II secretion system F family protein [Clostridiales bacterium]